MHISVNASVNMNHLSVKEIYHRMPILDRILRKSISVKGGRGEGPGGYKEIKRYKMQSLDLLTPSPKRFNEDPLPSSSEQLLAAPLQSPFDEVIC